MSRLTVSTFGCKSNSKANFAVQKGVQIRSKLWSSESYFKFLKNVLKHFSSRVQKKEEFLEQNVIGNLFPSVALRPAIVRNQMKPNQIAEERWIEYYTISVNFFRRSINFRPPLLPVTDYIKSINQIYSKRALTAKGFCRSNFQSSSTDCSRSTADKTQLVRTTSLILLKLWQTRVLLLLPRFDNSHGQAILVVMVTRKQQLQQQKKTTATTTRTVQRIVLNNNNGSSRSESPQVTNIFPRNRFHPIHHPKKD